MFSARELPLARRASSWPSASATLSMTSQAASDQQAAADSYVQIILASDPPYRIVWASEAWLRWARGGCLAGGLGAGWRGGCTTGAVE